MITILFYNEFWPGIPESLPDCPWPCELTRDRSRLPDARIVVVHIPTLRGPLALNRRPGQKWVAWSMESDVNYPALADPAFLGQFDLTMTYRRDSNVWVPYFGAGTLRELAEPPRSKSEATPAVYFASSAWDRSGRNRYAAELMQYVGVDSYGRCLRNRELERDEGRPTKLQTIARYKFTLAFENSISPDYVTEKFFDPLIAGSVPVYLGAPNIEEFLPGDRCCISVADYPGPRELAEHLRFLDDHDGEYESYLAWKSKPLRPSFLRMVDYTRVHPFCRLASLGPVP
jgi:hypothetical protein